MAQDKYIDRLLEISTKKYKLLQDMLALTRAQARSINEDGVEDLQKLIDEKQARIDEINKLDEEFGVYFQRMKQQMKVKSLDELDMTGTTGAKELQLCIGEIMNTMEEISRLEKENGDNAKKLLDSFSEEIRKLNQGKKMNTAYKPGGSMIPPSYFIDSKK